MSRFDTSGVIAFIRQFTARWNTCRGGLSYDMPGSRVWTRGDGTRYREPARMFSEDELIVEDAWQHLIFEGAQPYGSVSGEFGSSKFAPALKLGGLVFVRRGPRSIEIFTPSRISNPNSVWRHRPEEQQHDCLP